MTSAPPTSVASLAMMERPTKRSSQLGEGFQLVAQYLAETADRLDAESVLRGQASQDWAIQPSALRTGAYGIRNHDQLARWKAMAGRYERANSDLEWLALAQHYGIATTLLDWTFNPLVALFFAAQPATRLVNQNADGVIYMAKSSAFQQIPASNFDVFGEWADGPFFLLVEGTNRRAVTQSSVMTLHSAEAPQTPEYKPEIAFRLPGWAKFGVVAALAKMGLSAEMIYADINSAACEFSRQLHMEGAS